MARPRRAAYAYRGHKKPEFSYEDIGLAGAADGLPDRPAVPFALDTLTLMAPFAPRMFAWVRHAASAAQQEGLRKIDIDLCDEQGRVCAQLAGLALARRDRAV
jgi:hypothetical protein